MSQPGTNVPGTHYIQNLSAVATGLSLGKSNAVLIDNTTTPATVSVNGVAIVPAAFAEFYALMPSDNAGTIAVDTAIAFPQNGPTSSTGITRSSSSTTVFNLAAIGTYEISYQVSVTEAAQLVLWVTPSGGSAAKLARSVAGRASATDQIVNRFLLTTTTTNTLISLRNGASGGAITITANAGGSDAVGANLVIRQIA